MFHVYNTSMVPYDIRNSNGMKGILENSVFNGI